MFCGSVLMGYVIGNVSSLIAFEDSIHLTIKNRIDSLNAYMKHRELPTDLVTRMRRHFEHMWKHSTVYDEPSILQQLPPQLRAQVALQVNKILVERVPFFQNMRFEVLSEVLMRLKFLQVAADELVVVEGHYGREMYVIMSGKMAVVTGHPDATRDTVEYLASSTRAAAAKTATIKKQPRSTMVGRLKQRYASQPATKDGGGGEAEEGRGKGTAEASERSFQGRGGVFAAAATAAPLEEPLVVAILEKARRLTNRRTCDN